MHALLQDIRYALRQLRRAPGFTATAILTLALGIGAVTAMFSVIDSVLLKPLVFSRPDRLVVLRETAQELNNAILPANYKHYLNWKAHAKTIADAAISLNRRFSVAGDGNTNDATHPQMVGGMAISPNFFSVLGITPVQGRSFLPGEAVAGHDNVTILSWNAWQRYFHGNPSAIGSTLRVDGSPVVVVGILPRSFDLPHMNEGTTSVPQREVKPYEIFTPLVPRSNQLSDEGDYNFLVIGRLRDGVRIQQAESELSSLEQGMMQAAHLPYHARIVIDSLGHDIAGSSTTALWLLLAAVGTVLLMACVNLANLQMARAVAREGEMAVRAALGAGRKQLGRLILIDSLVLSALGGVLGILFSFEGVHLFISAAPSTVPRLDEAHVSLPILLAASALSIVSAVLVGVLPALRVMRTHPQSSLRSNTGKVASSREAQRTRHALVAGQVALTVVLLIVTGLLLRSFSHLLTQQRGFDAGHITLAEVHLSTPLYGDSMDQAKDVRAAFADRVISAISGLPGVQSTAITSAMPLSGETWVDSISRTDHPVPMEQSPQANMRWVSPEYLTALHVPLLRGRDLTAGDRNHPTNVLISEHTALAAWPGEDPVGKTFQTGPDSTYTVVGVVADARVNDLKKTTNMVYVPYWDNPPWSLFVLVRSAQPATVLAESIRKTIWNIDPQVPVPVVKSLDEQIGDSVATERFQTLLLSSFGASALLLALLGIYGVLAYSVSLRKREFGIRMALGSARPALARLVVLQMSRPVLFGIAAGLVLAYFATRTISSLLYETSAADPLVFVASVSTLIAAGFFAALIPARRAASIDPMQALRTE